MSTLSSSVRLAVADDAAALAILVNEAGEGLPLHLWSQMASDGQDPWEIGRARQAERAAKGQIWVVDNGDGAVAALTGYVIGPDPELPDAETPPLFRPLIALEAKAPNTWYVNVLASLPDHRGFGYGRQLLALAEDLAREEGLSTMSLIAGGENEGALRLYERVGYRRGESLPVETGGWDTRLKTWILMTKTLG